MNVYELSIKTAEMSTERQQFLAKDWPEATAKAQTLLKQTKEGMTYPSNAEILKLEKLCGLSEVQ